MKHLPIKWLVLSYDLPESTILHTAERHTEGHIFLMLLRGVVLFYFNTIKMSQNERPSLNLIMGTLTFSTHTRFLWFHKIQGLC